MQVAKILVSIHRDTVCVTQTEVPEHELLVLEAVHDERCLSDSVQASPNMHQFESLEEEWERLAQHYGKSENGTPYVAMAYGNPHEFKRQLQAIVNKRK